MIENKYAVIFDTNSYREFVSKKSNEDVILLTEKLRKAESEKGIKVFGSVIVLMEMVANLAEGETGFNYKDCLNGIVSMANHCFDNANMKVRIVPHAYLLITKSFFGKVSEKAEKNVFGMAGLLNDFRNDKDKAIKHYKKQSTFDDYKTYINELEEDFAQEITGLINGIKQNILTDIPNITSKNLRKKTLDLIEQDIFEVTMSIAIIEALAAKLSIQVSNKEKEKMSTFLREVFPIASGFFKWICREIVDKNIDLYSKTSKNERWNWIWDYNISFAISNSVIDKRDVLLVTSDKPLTRMLSDYGFNVRVMVLKEYLKYINYRE